MAHVAQRGVGGAESVEAAELEADGLAARVAAGGRLERPRMALGAEAAAEAGATRAKAKRRGVDPRSKRMELVVWKAARGIQLSADDLAVCADPETQEVTAHVRDPGAQGRDLTEWLEDVARRAQEDPGKLEEARIEFPNSR